MSSSRDKTEARKKSNANLKVFVAGKSGNEKGRPKLPKEIHEIKKEALEKAIQILHEKIMDDTYMNKLDGHLMIKFMETTFDRFGLPKVTKQEMTGKDGEPLDNKLIVEFVGKDE
jgi:hypothetical protein